MTIHPGSLHHSFDIDLACLYGTKSAIIINLIKEYKLNLEQLIEEIPYLDSNVITELIDYLIKQEIVYLNDSKVLKYKG